MFLSFFFFPSWSKQFLLVSFILFPGFRFIFFFLPTTCNVLPYICSTQRLMLPLISNIYIFQTLVPPLISFLIDKFAGAASSVLVMLEMNFNHAIHACTWKCSSVKFNDVSKRFIKLQTKYSIRPDHNINQRPKKKSFDGFLQPVRIPLSRRFSCFSKYFLEEELEKRSIIFIIMLLKMPPLVTTLFLAWFYCS